jgi:hypothetical protein
MTNTVKRACALNPSTTINQCCCTGVEIQIYSCYELRENERSVAQAFILFADVKTATVTCQNTEVSLGKSAYDLKSELQEGRESKESRCR